MSAHVLLNLLNQNMCSKSINSKRVMHNSKRVNMHNKDAYVL